MSGSCRLTVVSDGRRADVSLPATVPVADVIADVTDLMLGRSPDVLPDPLVLARPTGPALPLDRSLDELDVVDGDVLMLREAAETPGVPVVDDLAEAVSEALERRPGRWSTTERRRLLPLAGALIAALGGMAFLGPLAGALGGGSLLAFALALLAAGAVLERVPPSGVTGAAVAAASLPWFAAAPAGFFEAGGATLASAMAGSGLGLLVGVGLVIVAAPRVVAPVAGLGIPAAAGAIAGGAMLAGLGAVDVAAVVAVVSVATLYLLPGAAMRASGLVDISDRATVSEVNEVVEHGRQLLPALLAGAGAVAALAAGVLAWFGTGAAPFLAVAVAGCLLLRTRSLDFTAEIVAVGGSGLLASALVASAAARLPIGVAAIPFVTVLGGLAIALAGALGGAPGSPGGRRLLARVEVTSALALIPLCLAVVGFFGVVADLGNSLGLSR